MPVFLFHWPSLIYQIVYDFLNFNSAWGWGMRRSQKSLTGWDPRWDLNPLSVLSIYPRQCCLVLADLISCKHVWFYNVWWQGLVFYFSTANNFLRLLATETSGRYHRCHSDFDAQLFAHKLLTEGFGDAEVINTFFIEPCIYSQETAFDNKTLVLFMPLKVNEFLSVHPVCVMFLFWTVVELNMWEFLNQLF